MMSYERQPENEYQETSTEMRIATAVAVAVAAWEVAGQMRGLPSMAAWDWIILYRAVAIGLFVGGATYAIVLIAIKLAPGLPALLLEKAEAATGLDLDGKPQPKRDLPTGQPKREIRQPLQIETLPLADDEEDSEPLPQWITNTDKMVWGDRLNINNHLMDIPDGFNVDWLYTVAEKRMGGHLETISLRALDDIGISRWGNGNSPAAQLITVLEESGCIQSLGERQPYSWTDGGNRAFPTEI